MLDVIPCDRFGLAQKRRDVPKAWIGQRACERTLNRLVNERDRLARPAMGYSNTPAGFGLMKA